MPELPEVESVVRSLRPRLVGRQIHKVESSGFALRRPIDLRRLRRACEGAQASVVRRTGKYLIVELSSGDALLAHLGMSGRLVFRDEGAPLEPHTHARFHLDGAIELRYIDHRRFGVLRALAGAKLAESPELAVLGPDPFDAGFTADYLARELAASKRDVKSFLLDQSRVAGLGNIYAAEALFHAGVSPRRRAHRMGAERAARLHRAILMVLEQGIQNRGTSFSDYVDADGEAGNNQSALFVYGRQGEACRRCGQAIRRLVQGARSTFFCPRCQR
jgi:formamidopyrimidine-DNA glycosylase